MPGVLEGSNLKRMHGIGIPAVKGSKGWNQIPSTNTHIFGINRRKIGVPLAA